MVIHEGSNFEWKPMWRTILFYSSSTLQAGKCPESTCASVFFVFLNEVGTWMMEAEVITINFQRPMPNTSVYGPGFYGLMGTVYCWPMLLSWPFMNVRLTQMMLKNAAMNAIVVIMCYMSASKDLTYSLGSRSESKMSVTVKGLEALSSAPTWLKLPCHQLLVAIV